jgi:hypothetical protein
MRLGAIARILCGVAFLRSAITKNAVVTYAHLMSYFERAKMEPRTGGFGDDEPGGDFLFIARQK